MYVGVDNGGAAYTNLLPNPSFETGIAGWVSSAAPTYETLNWDTAKAYSGRASLRVQLVTQDMGYTYVDSPPVLGTSGYNQFSAWVQSSGVAANEVFKIEIWRSATQNGTYSLAATGPWFPITGAWQRVAQPVQHDVSRPWVWFRVICGLNTAGLGGRTFWLDSAVIESSLPLSTTPLRPAFDGDTLGHVWVGTPHASASRYEGPSWAPVPPTSPTWTDATIAPGWTYAPTAVPIRSAKWAGQLWLTGNRVFPTVAGSIPADSLLATLAPGTAPAATVLIPCFAKGAPGMIYITPTGTVTYRPLTVMTFATTDYITIPNGPYALA
jgi:hypothetical protein